MLAIDQPRLIFILEDLIYITQESPVLCQVPAWSDPSLSQNSPSWSLSQVQSGFKTELGTRPCLSFATTATQQRNRSSLTEKIRKMFRSPCLNGVATKKIDIMQDQHIFWPENMVTLSRQCCHLPISSSREHF